MMGSSVTRRRFSAPPAPAQVPPEPLPELHDLVRWLALRVKVLELGCGEGVNALWLAEQGFNTTAVEASPQRVQRLRQEAEARSLPLRVEQHDPRCYPLRGMYDLLMLHDGMGEVSPVEAVGLLRRMQAHTRRGGFHVVAIATTLAVEPAGERLLEFDPGAELFRLYDGWRVIGRQGYLAGADDPPGRCAARVLHRLIAQRR